MHSEKTINKEIVWFKEVSLPMSAKIAGFSLVIMTILSLLSFPFLQNLIIPNDAIKTVDNIKNARLLFGLIISVILIIIFLDVIIAWALYILLKPVNKSFSLLMAWFRIIYAAVFTTSLTNLYIVANNSGNADFHDKIMINLYSFISGWDIGLAIFGIHLLFLGYLVFKSVYLPQWIGILVIIASMGYLIDSFGKVLSPDYKINIGMFTFIGEVLLGVWLMFKGRKLADIKKG